MQHRNDFPRAESLQNLIWLRVNKIPKWRLIKQLLKMYFTSLVIRIQTAWLQRNDLDFRDQETLSKPKILCIYFQACDCPLSSTARAQHAIGSRTSTTPATSWTRHRSTTHRTTRNVSCDTCKLCLLYSWVVIWHYQSYCLFCLGRICYVTIVNNGLPRSGFMWHVK